MKRGEIDKELSNTRKTLRRWPVHCCDVDDECGIAFGDHWKLSANWRTNSIDCRQIIFNLPDGTIENFQLGLCPEEAYQSMIKDAIEHVDDHEFWIKQYEIDTWIHERIENL